MRFAFVTSEISPFVGGGIAPMVRATAQLLAGAGHDVDLFTRASFRSQALRCDPLPPLLMHPRVRWHWVPEPANAARHWHLAMAEAFADAVAETYASAPPDLVEVQDYLGLGGVIVAGRCDGALRDAPVVTRLNTSAEQAAHVDQTELDVRAAPEIRLLERASLRSADALLAPSPAVHDFYREFYEGETLAPDHVVWPGFLRDDAPQRQRRRDPDGVLRLLYVGRLQRIKGTDLLVEAFRGVQAPDLAVTLLGGDTMSGPGGTSMRAHLRRVADGDPRITFAPPVPRSEVAAAFAAADALVVSSRWETWGNVGLEALAAGRPLLVTPLASLPAMTDGGRLGLVAPSIDVDGVAQLLRDAHADRDRLVQLAGSQTLTRHLDEIASDARVVEQYERLTELTPRTERADTPESLAAALPTRAG